MIHTPSDNQEMTEKYLKDKGGVCGQCCIAVIERSSVKDVLENWQDMGLEWKGWSGWKQLKQYLEKRSYKVKLKRMNNLGSFIYDNYYILRVQWLGEKENQEKPFYGWGHWTEASAHTHFIIVHQGQIFCNETGWFYYHKLTNYLNENNGVITSAMEVSI